MERDIIMIDEVMDIDIIEESVKSEFSFILVCNEGCIQSNIDGKMSFIVKNDLIICLPNTIFDNSTLSPDFRGKAMLISEKFIKNVFPNNMDIWNKAFYLSKHPILHLNDKDVATFNEYFELLNCKINQKDHYYKYELVCSLFMSSFYDMSNSLFEFVKLEQNKLSRKDILFKNFMELLSKNFKEQRTVLFYSNKLCVTTKYLSLTSREISGKSASKWIQEFTIKEIVRLLKDTTMPIKEISNTLDFPNTSFFGRYVSTHLGMSPAKYRNAKSVSIC
nr:helix-turn-helix domain-containing protein [uncultured Macellibacteroides sp.]